MRRPIRRFATTLTITVTAAVGQQAVFAQGPLLFPPAPGESRTNAQERSSYYRQGSDYGNSVPGSYSRDSRMAQVAEWYRAYLGREIGQSEARNWEVYLQQNVGELSDVQAHILGSPEFYERAGGNLHEWLDALASVTGQRLERAEIAQWRDLYQREGNRIAFTKRFLNSQQSYVNRAERTPQQTYRPVTTHRDHNHYQGQPRNDYGWRERPSSSLIWPGGTIGSTNPGWLPGQTSPILSVQPRHDHDHHVGHDHGRGTPYTALRPVAPLSEADLIADWYRSYFSREAGPHEVQKWLTDLNKGMPLSEVYASIIAADEWYARNGSSPSRWIAGTLDVLGQNPDPDSVGYWLDRYRRHGGDRFRTTMEMVDRYGVPGGVGSNIQRSRDRHDRHRFDHDD